MFKLKTAITLTLDRKKNVKSFNHSTHNLNFINFAILQFSSTLKIPRTAEQHEEAQLPKSPSNVLKIWNRIVVDWLTGRGFGIHSFDDNESSVIALRRVIPELPQWNESLTCKSAAVPLKPALIKRFLPGEHSPLSVLLIPATVQERTETVLLFFRFLELLHLRFPSFSLRWAFVRVGQSEVTFCLRVFQCSFQ